MRAVGGQLKSISLLEAKWRRPIVELVLNASFEDKASVTIDTPFTSPRSGRVFHKRPTPAFHGGRARPNAGDVVVPIDGVECDSHVNFAHITSLSTPD
jgi:hypothetical protein